MITLGYFSEEGCCVEEVLAVREELRVETLCVVVPLTALQAKFTRFQLLNIQYQLQHNNSQNTRTA